MLSLLPLVLLISACTAGKVAVTDDSAPDDSGADDSGDTDEPQVNDACLANFDRVDEMFPEAGTLGECTGDGAVLAASLMNLDGITIDNDGVPMQPCVQVRCDEDHAYVTTNDLPFYDYIDTTGHILAERQLAYRIPLDPEPFEGGITGEEVEEIEEIEGCVNAYNAYVAGPDSPTGREPSEYCVADSVDADYMVDPATGRTVHKIFCLSQSGMMITGSPAYGPTEAIFPLSYDAPAYWYPVEDGGDRYYDGTSSALDLCGFHTWDVGHNHVANEACYALDGENRPKNTYDDVEDAWNLLEQIDGDCEVESGIVAWAMDGHPIKGPCVCVERDDDDNCVSVKRARSSWHYAGLSAWSEHTDASEDSAGLLELEGTACTDDDECCPDGVFGCEYACQVETFPDESTADGSVVDRRCVLHDYAWCSHEFTDHSDADEPEDFVYMDICNGYDGPDGYTYHATMSFPYFPSCYVNKPSRSIEGVQAIELE